MTPQKSDFLQHVVKHYDMKILDPRPLVSQMGDMAFQARNLERSVEIYNRMLADDGCAVILCLAGSLVSAGLKQIIIDMVRHRMVDCIVSTGANLVDQDFFEGLGYKHYKGDPTADDAVLRELAIDRIYDTFIDEDELRVCDDTVRQICDGLEPRPYSSREILAEMGRYLKENGKTDDSILQAAFEADVPVFCPAFSDCSAGFGLVMHQYNRTGPKVTVDSAADFLELTRIKLACKDTGLLMIGGGVPKNFAQDIVVAAELLGAEVPMHKYAIQLTVADERDGALSGSTLKEASSWGKVDLAWEQMVYGEATLTFPLLAGAAFFEKKWETRTEKRLSQHATETPAATTNA